MPASAGHLASVPPLRGKAAYVKPVHARINMSRRVTNFKFLTGQIFCWLLILLTPLVISATSTGIFGLLQRDLGVVHPPSESISELWISLCEAVGNHRLTWNPLEIPAVLPQGRHIDLNSSLHEGRRDAVNRIEQRSRIRHRIDRNWRPSWASRSVVGIHRLRQHTSKVVGCILWPVQRRCFSC